MKIFFLFSLLLSLSYPCLAQEDMPNNITLALEEQDSESTPITLNNMLETAVEVGKYFQNNYPDNLIDSDLKPDIAKFFPEADTQELYDKENFIRKSIKLFRWGKEKIAAIKSKILVPDTPILTYKDSEYENPTDYDYQDVGEDQVRITTDIKKVISYSHDPKEIETYEAHLQKKQQDHTLETKYPSLARLKKAYDKIEWKKLPFYGIIYDDPKTEGEGISPWQKSGQAQVRLASDQSRLDNRSEIKGIVQFALEQGWLLLAQPYNQYPDIVVNFSHSQNIKKCQVFQPTPHRIPFKDGDLIMYFNNLAYPFICEVEDNKQPAVINADINFSLCNAQKQCENNRASLSLPILDGFGFGTVLQNFITQSFTHLPDTQETNIMIQDVSIEENPDSPSGQTLRLIIDNNNNYNNPDFFVRTPRNTLFSSPRTAIDNHRASVRMDILTSHEQLIGTPLEITIRTDNFHSYRFTKTILSSSVFDIHSRKLTLGLWLLAMLGGFILNFMPCVFPVLSLKILSLTEFGAKNQQAQKRSFILSILGILTSFLILSGILCLLKLIGHNLGWGMQFQNPLFITTMIFVILLFLAQLHGYIRLNILPLNYLSKPHASHSWNAFFSGILVVVMATPCTGPYLGTTIGFALSGTPFDIFAILMAVAIGLALPYFLLLLIPNLSVLIPHPGPWMQKLHWLMSLMLWLTVLWLLSILKAQSSFTTCIGIIGCMLIFYALLRFYNRCQNEIEKITTNTTIRQNAKRLMLIIYGFILTFILSIALIIGYIGFSHHHQTVQKQSIKQLDFTQIGQDVSNGWNVLIKVNADWCLTCSYNNFLVFNNSSTQKLYDRYKVKIVNVDWTEYNPEILKFMSEYGRRGLPFYILYNRNIPEGIVLPELLNQMTFKKILENSGIAVEDDFINE
ncbi:MAG: thioredoxin family protein [Alphaproteobacteria bacterium]|nr:thioredoxin family protein [Alphaproteobacteria bacterium]